MGETQTAKRPALDSSAADALLADGQDLLHRRDFEGALDLFQLASGLRPGNVEIEGYIDMVRGQLLRSYRERMNGLATPCLIADRAAITRFNLPGSMDQPVDRPDQSPGDQEGKNHPQDSRDQGSQKIKP